MKKSNLEQLQNIAEQSRGEVYVKHGMGTSEQIHERYFTDFAKAMVDKLEKENYQTSIIVTDNFELMGEIEGYNTEPADVTFSNGVPHCFVKVENEYETYFFDACDVQGVNSQDDLFYSLKN